MNPYYNLLVVCLVALLLVPVYIRLARKFRWLDIPNERSSHNRPTLLSAGWIILLTMVIGSMILELKAPLILIALSIGGITGFIDDRIHLNASIRALFYGIALLILLYILSQMNLLQSGLWLLIILPVGLGTVNAYNFMDGINGITVLYSILFLLTYSILPAIETTSIQPLIHSALIGCVVFSVLNLRPKAIAFMGDIGSVSLGLLIVFLLLHAILQSGSIVYLMMVLVYGIDTVITIAERLLRRQNIFSAHRQHLYQQLCIQLNWSHLRTALIFASIQLLINLIMVYSLLNHFNGNLIFLMTAIVFGSFYLWLKYLRLPQINKTIL